MIHQLPEEFLKRFENIVPQSLIEIGLGSFSADKLRTARVNTLIVNRSVVEDEFRQREINFKQHALLENCFIVSEDELPKIDDLLKVGKVYLQSPSSMLVSHLLNPEHSDTILDLCAAPGSKTSHLAALMQNQGKIVAVENVKNRFYKLKAVLSLLGVKNTECKFCDGRRFRPPGVLFDKVLVDAPCSSEGRFKVQDKKSYAFWSVRKIKEMQHKQKGLLLSASRLLKRSGILLYSTCTFAPEENEGVISWFLKKTKEPFSLQEIKLSGIRIYPSICQWENKTYDTLVSRCIRILPDEFMDGFFMAKLKKE